MLVVPPDHRDELLSIAAMVDQALSETGRKRTSALLAAREALLELTRTAPGT